jgi:NADH-quinone oxidoreductase subunit N
MDIQLINPENLVVTSGQLFMAAPYFVLLFGAMAGLLFGVSNRFSDQMMTKAISVGTILVAIYFTWLSYGEPNQALFNKMLACDAYASYFNLLFLFIALYICISSFSYIEMNGINHPEYYTLILFTALGMMLLANALDLIVLFVALEIMSIAVYVLVGFKRNDVRSNEGAIKYFVLGSAASAVFLYGTALIYGAIGTFNIVEIATVVRSGTGPNTLFILGALFVLIGFLFKVAAAPFHMWSPDVYEGAPVTITNLMTTGVKAAAFASFVRVFASLDYFESSGEPVGAYFKNVLWILAVVTMFVGNVIALTQPNLKRMLAYSSISHTGYIIVGMIGAAQLASGEGYSAILTYITTYVVANLGAFGILSYLANSGDGCLELSDLAGLGSKRPLQAFALMVFMLSMAGVPPTAGFIGKYLMFSSAVQAGEIWLVILAVLCSAISAYYYLRVIVMMYMKDPIHDFDGRSSGVTQAALAGATVALTIQVGLFPSSVMVLAERAVISLAGLY